MADHAKNLRTKDEIQRYINKDLLPEWSDKPIATITRADVKSLIREKARTSPIAANRLLSVISKIFSWALDEEIVGASPAVRIKRPGQEVERERSLTDDEIRVLWPAFSAVGYPFGSAFKFLLVTGQRRGEVGGMTWAEIDGEAWLLPGARAKSKQGHRVPLSSLAREILADTPHIGDNVFTASRGSLLTGWDTAKSRADMFLKKPIEPWRIHDLRRTMATQMRSLGVDRLVVSKLLNHAESGITKTYDRYAADPEKAAAMERWADRLREIISGEKSEKVVLLRGRESDEVRQASAVVSTAQRPKRCSAEAEGKMLGWRDSHRRGCLQAILARTALANRKMAASVLAAYLQAASRIQRKPQLRGVEGDSRG